MEISSFNFTMSRVNIVTVNATHVPGASCTSLTVTGQARTHFGDRTMTIVRQIIPLTVWKNSSLFDGSVLVGHSNVSHV